MRLSLAEPGYLKDSISIISELVNEGRFKITPDAIELIAMDPANVAMVVFKLFSSSFTEYDVKTDTEIAINLSNLKQILKRAGSSDILTIEMGTDNKLQIRLKGASTRTFSIPIIELEEREQKVPELEFSVKLDIPCDMINGAIEDVDIVGESVTFLAEGKKVTIQSEGDLSKARIDMQDGDDLKIENTSADPIKAKYSIEYLKKMVAGSKLADRGTIEFSKDYPMKMEFKVVDKVQLAFILAPRVEND